MRVFKMRALAKFSIMCLVTILLTNCAKTTTPVESRPAATEISTAVLIDPFFTNEPGDSQDTVEIDGTTFVRRVIRVESAAVAAADFDKDGNQDLVSAGEPQLTIFRGDGEGNLISFSQVQGGENPVDFALADLDEDDNVDIVIANHDTDYLTILLGNGHGEFQPAPNSPLRTIVRPHPHAVQAADLDGDGHMDLIIDHREAEGLLILRGLGQGRFELPGSIVEVGGDPYRGMAVGDINGDGKLDLVTPNPTEVGVLLNTSSEQISFTQMSPVEADAPFAVELGDFNGDNKPDLMVASDEGSELVELFFGNGHGEFEKADESPFHFAPGGKKIAVGDFNGDGIEDAVVSSYQSVEVLVLMGDPGSIRSGYFQGDKNPWGLAVADFNEDGRDDLVIADDTSGRAMVYLSIEP
jgi:hypothetical protein